MFLVNWFKNALESLGLMNKKAKIVFLGLDDAGKTTLLLRLKEDVMKQMDPTQQPYSEELVLGISYLIQEKLDSKHGILEDTRLLERPGETMFPTSTELYI
jgi:GTPase SAR1 family protein